MESKLLSVIVTDREAYEQLKDHLDPDDFSEYPKAVLKTVYEYYEKDPKATSVDKGILVSRLEREYPNHVKLLSILVSELGTTSVPNVLEEYVDLRIQKLSVRLGNILALGKVSPEADKLMVELNELRGEGVNGLLANDRILHNESLEDIFLSLQPENLIPVYPSELASVFDGGFPRGSHIVVFARPETGKSMFSVNYAANLAKDGYTVLYAGNEDPAKTMYSRVACCLLSTNSYEIRTNPSMYQEAAVEMGLGNLHFLDATPGTIGQLKRVAKSTQADVVIVDQLKNLTLPRGFGRVEGLEHLAQEVRNLAKDLNIVGVSVTQAGDSADNKSILGMGDVDFSNTGIPGSADVMLGIGVDYSLDAMNQRCITPCKNKITGNHTPVKVRVYPETSKVENIV